MSNRGSMLRDTRNETTFKNELLVSESGVKSSEIFSKEDRYKEIEFYWIRRDPTLPKDSTGQHPVVEEAWGKNNEKTTKDEKKNEVDSNFVLIDNNESGNTSSQDNLKKKTKTEVEAGVNVVWWMLLGGVIVVVLLIKIKARRNGKTN